MNTEIAIEIAGSREALAKVLGAAPISTYRWKPDLPKNREFQLRVLRPRWFSPARIKAAREAIEQRTRDKTP